GTTWRKLTDAEELQYWEECARAAEFQTINPDDVPRTRAGIQQYFEQYRPQMAGSEVAQNMMNYLVDLGYHILPERVPSWMRRVFNWPMRRAIIATMPKWMRTLGGIPQNYSDDVIAKLIARPFLRAVSGIPRLELAVLDFTTPHTTPIVGPALMKIPAQNPVTYTPAEARKKFGRTTPFEQYQALLAKRELGQGPKPYEHNHNDALLEFEAHAG
ncbi:MAG: DUF2236 domain-containing protein, partial [Actinobacteria bacterium]|nr:DUF2236 domain-containing protein [Actinomycetota bacterium]